MQNVDVPPGSNVLITGVNGLIASNIAEEFLALNYNVIGTVRSTSRCAWLIPFFQARHTPTRGTFTLIELRDLADEAAFARAYAAHRIAAVCLTTGAMDFGQTAPEPSVGHAVETVRAPMRAARQHPLVTSFVLTGSVWAVYMPRGGVARELAADTYNDDAVAAAYGEAWEDAGARGLAVFGAGFVAKDRAARAFVREERPGFRATVLLVDCVMGRILNTEQQGLPTSIGFVAGVWEGGEKARPARALIKPQHHVDVEDCAKLHVAAAVRGDVVNERIFTFGEPFTWNKVLRIFKKNWPQRKFDDEDPSEGECLAKAPNERGAQLLRDMGGKGWTSLEESVVKTIKTGKLV
ncbi:hypothetical protein SLS57_010149 [Botryosphaeria dothidea]